LGGMTGGPGDTTAAVAAGQACAGGWAYAQQRARANARSGEGVGRAGCGWAVERWAARESAEGGARWATRELGCGEACWAAMGGGEWAALLVG
jgi:hypothetical protein